MPRALKTIYEEEEKKFDDCKVNFRLNLNATYTLQETVSNEIKVKESYDYLKKTSLTPDKTHTIVF